LRAGVALVSRGEFNIVIAGLAVAAGRQADLGPLAAAYVLVLAVVGPLAARLANPVVRRIAERRRPASAGPAPVPAQPQKQVSRTAPEPRP
jgi:K+:H+ antiporter subunit KhtU